MVRIYKLGLVLAGAVAIATPALAQDQGIASELERVASTSPQEKIQFAEDATEEMTRAEKDVSKLLDSVRGDSGVEQLRCLNASLSSIRALLQVSEAATVAMKEALQGGEDLRAEHEFRKIAVARYKVQQLQAEAAQCINDSGLSSGDTRVVFSQELDKPIDETDEIPDDYDFGYDPPESSPFL